MFVAECQDLGTPRPYFFVPSLDFELHLSNGPAELSLLVSLSLDPPESDSTLLLQ